MQNPSYKLDLCYFTEPGRCPLMVRRQSRGAFELFLFLAQRFLKVGQPVSAEHEELCAACGIQAAAAHSRSSISRLLRSLREVCKVIDYQPRRRRTPSIALAPACPGADPLRPRHYVNFYDGWSGGRRAMFDALGPRAFAAEYMYFIAEYESALARVKHGRAYWFYPLEQISATYHVSTAFASTGLRALVKLGAMRICFGQYGIQAAGDEFGASNRYYFEGLGGSLRRQWQLEAIERQHPAEFAAAVQLSAELANGATLKNVSGLCELIADHGEGRVRVAVGRVAALPLRSLKRRLAYVRAIVASSPRRRRKSN